MSPATRSTIPGRCSDRHDGLCRKGRPDAAPTGPPAYAKAPHDRHRQARRQHGRSVSSDDARGLAEASFSPDKMYASIGYAYIKLSSRRLAVFPLAALSASTDRHCPGMGNQHRVSRATVTDGELCHLSLTSRRERSVHRGGSGPPTRARRWLESARLVGGQDNRMKKPGLMW